VLLTLHCVGSTEIKLHARPRKTDYWYENEYVVDAATTFILLANATESISH
jgi:hypothetical protein